MSYYKLKIIEGSTKSKNISVKFLTWSLYILVSKTWSRQLPILRIVLECWRPVFVLMKVVRCRRTGGMRPDYYGAAMWTVRGVAVDWSMRDLKREVRVEISKWFLEYFSNNLYS